MCIRDRALIHDIVDGKHRFYTALRPILVLGLDEHGDHGGVPVVDVHHIGHEIDLFQALQHGAGEVGLSLIHI